MQFEEIRGPGRISEVAATIDKGISPSTSTGRLFRNGVILTSWENAHGSLSLPMHASIPSEHAIFETHCLYMCKFCRSHSNSRFEPRPYRNHKCDCCGGRITEACTICLDCKTKESEPFDYVALCQSKACITSCVPVTQRPDLVGSHEPTHRVVKIRAFIPGPVLPLLLASAENVWKKIETVCMNVEQEQDGSYSEVSKGQLSRPPCRFCRRPFTLPFWYCVDCHGLCPSHCPYPHLTALFR